MYIKCHFLLAAVFALVSCPLASQSVAELFENPAVIGVSEIDLDECEAEAERGQSTWTWQMSVGPETRHVMEVAAGHALPESWTLEKVEFKNPDVEVSLMERGGLKSSHRYQTRMNFYRIISQEWRGFFAFHPDHVQGLLMGGGQTFELAPAGLLHEGRTRQHAWLHVEAVPQPKAFDCGSGEHVSLAEGVAAMADHVMERAVLDPVCAEVALDMDHYTYSTFNSCADAVDWALGLLAGANEVYLNSLDNTITLQPVHMNIWFSPEPWSGISGDGGGMLTSFRDTWNNDPYLSTVDRDVAHLLTKRDDTGTGGIAWTSGTLGQGVLCSSNAFGFSSDLSQSTSSYPNYSWNLNVICHELGHNFGSRHTHWCGWPGDGALHPNGWGGGAFLVCTDPEEGPNGLCNNPVQENVGTIMSYCHNNGSIVLDFHPVVQAYGILPNTTGGGCLSTCDGFIEPCSALGCTDPGACNYTSEAVVDDGTCTYPEFSYVDCQGNCLEDVDSDGVCDAIDSCVGQYDECGTCNGPGAVLDCGCFDVTGAIAPSEFSQVYSLSGSQTSTQTHSWQGTLSAAQVALQFSGVGDSYPGDMQMQITDPNGNCVVWGGYNIEPDLTCVNLDDTGDGWPGSWQTTVNGSYSTNVYLGSVGLSGMGTWELTVQNGWTGSAAATYDLSVNFVGLTDICNCNGDSTDILGQCGGGCTSDIDMDGVCDDVDDCVGEFDECGVCNGEGANYECGCEDIPEGWCDCDGTALDSDGDGICDEDEVLGCGNPSACNYNPLATDSDGSCVFFYGFTINQPSPVGEDVLAGETVSVFVSPQSNVTYTCWARDPLQNTIFGPQVGTSWEFSFPAIAGTGRVYVEGAHDVGGDCVILEQRTLNVMLPPPVGLDERAPQVSDLNVYPNPATHELTVQLHGLPLTASAAWSLRVLNLAGQTVVRFPAQASIAIPVEHYAEGMYFLRLEGPTGTTICRFVVAGGE